MTKREAALARIDSELATYTFDSSEYLRLGHVVFRAAKGTGRPRPKAKTYRKAKKAKK